MKPGWKTTEFWAMFVLAMLTAFVNSGFVPDTHWSIKVASIVITGLTVMGYQYTRTQLKVAHVNNPELIEEKTP